jgi:N-acetylneuraminic acid mutarotase
MSVIKGTRPRARYGQTLSLLNNRLIMIAGTVYHEYFNDVWEFDRETKTWTCLRAGGDKIPSPRFGHSAVLLPNGRDLLVFGGSNNSIWSCDTYVFNTETVTWQELQCDVKPSERRGHSMVQVQGGALLLYGGQSANSQKDIWQFDPTTMTWMEIIPTPTSPCIPEARYCHSAVAYEEHMIVWGGHGSWGCVPSNVYAFHVGRKEWAQWDTTGTAPCSRFGHAAVCTGHRMIVFGGMDVYPTGISYQDMHQLNLYTHVWQKVQLEGSIPRGRRLHSMTDVGAMFVVFGGWNGAELFDDAFEIRMEPLTLKELMRQFILTHRVTYDASSAQSQ